MEEWNKVVVQKDVDKLLYICGRFHDTCIVSVNYKSGAAKELKNTYVIASALKWRAVTGDS